MCNCLYLLRILKKLVCFVYACWHLAVNHQYPYGNQASASDSIPTMLRAQRWALLARDMAL